MEVNQKSQRLKVAGIGNRNIPKEASSKLFDLGRLIAERNYLGLSGNSNGSDEFFAKGVNSVNPSLMNLYLPWNSFNKNFILPENKVRLLSKEDKAKCIAIASEHHPNWSACSFGAKSCLARNVAIVTDANVVFCYSDPNSKSGGTKHAVRIANAYQIPVYNLFTLSLEDCISALGD